MSLNLANVIIFLILEKILLFLHAEFYVKVKL